MQAMQSMEPLEAERPSDVAVSWVLHGLVVVAAAGAVALDRRVRRAVPSAPPVAPFVVSGAFYAVLGALEARRPHRRDWRPGRDEVLTDAAFLASLALTPAAGGVLSEQLRHRSSGTLGVDRLPVAAGVALGVLAYDLVHSRFHHLGHRWGPAWRVHSVHHSPERLYFFNATRFQITETVVDTALEAVVIGLLDLNRDQHIAYQTVRATYGQLQHCNIALRSGPLDHVFSTPDLHRWHHSVVYEEGDTNYGAITSVWDKVFRTFYRPPGRRGPDRLGVGRMPDFPRKFWELERVPFQWRAIRERNASTWFARD